MKKKYQVIVSISVGIFISISVIFGYSDIDHDGLVNKDELYYGTNLLNPDTDSDGLTDGYELWEYKTSPIHKDTDKDGLDDKVEWAYDHCSPRNSI